MRKPLFFSVALLFFLSRCLKLLDMPIVTDEATFLYLARLIIDNPLSPFVSLNHGHQPFHTWLLILPSLTISNPLIAGRIISVLSGFASFTGLWCIARFYSLNFGKWFVILSFVFSPLFLLHDRLAIKDGFLAAVAIWLFYFSLRWVQTMSWRWVLFAAVSLGVGLLTKSIATFFVLLAPFGLLHVDTKSFNFRKLLWQGLLFYGIAFGMHSILRLSSGFHRIAPHNEYHILTWFELLNNPFQLFWSNGVKVIDWFHVYLGWPAVLAFPLAWLLLWKRHKGVLFVLSAWILLPVGVEIFVGRTLAPRYLLFTIPFWYLLIGFFLEEIFLRLEQNSKKMAQGVVAILALLLLWPPSLLSAKIFHNLPQAPLAAIDRWQYLEGWPSGYGFLEAVQFFRNQPEPCIILTEKYHCLTELGLPLFLKSSSCEVKSVSMNDEKENLERMRAQFPNSNLFLVLNQRQKAPLGQESLQELAAYPKVGGKEFMRIFKVAHSKGNSNITH